MSDLTPQVPAGELILFKSTDGTVRLECRFAADTLWLSQAEICTLYGKAKATISEHISHVLAEGECSEDAVVRFYRTTADDGKPYNVKYYSLPLILAVGYRVRSPQGTQFRQWATATLEEFLIKGFAMDDERLKNPPIGASAMPDYFDEMLERIRDIRASERRMYLRVKDIFTLAADYSPSDKDTTTFFQIMQNKLHFAATGLTAAELISQRVDMLKPDMGLTSFKGSDVRKTDVTIAKNYLQENEIKALNRIVTMWLDYAEDQTLQRKQVFLREWKEKLDQFLRFNNRDLLQGAGQISKANADSRAKAVYDEFETNRRRLRESEGELSALDALVTQLNSDESNND